MNRRRRPEKLLLTAYHEAGHTVVAHALGKRIERVSIKPMQEGHDEGYSQHDWPRIGGVEDIRTFTLDLPHIHENLAERFAGREAEILKCEKDGWSTRRIPLGDDIRIARGLATNFPEEERQAALENAHARARNILIERWQAVEKLVTELLKHKTISGDYAEAVINQALNT